MFSQSQTYWDMVPVVSSRLVQFPELRQGFSAQEVLAVLQVVPVKPGGQTHSVVKADVSTRGKHTPPLPHSAWPEHRSAGESRSARLLQLYPAVGPLDRQLGVQTVKTGELCN